MSKTNRPELTFSAETSAATVAALDDLIARIDEQTTAIKEGRRQVPRLKQ